MMINNIDSSKDIAVAYSLTPSLHGDKANNLYQKGHTQDSCSTYSLAIQQYICTSTLLLACILITIGQSTLHLKQPWQIWMAANV